MHSGKLASIDPDERVPKYVQAKAILMGAIRSGAFLPGTKLPPTDEISSQIKVSLVTAHRAIQLLVSEGWLHRRQGRGTFVRDDFEQCVAAKSRRRIGLFLDPVVQLGDYYHGALLQGLRAASAGAVPGAEFSVHFGDTPASLREITADGFICFHPFRESFAALEVMARELPIVVLGGSWAGTELHCVDSCNEEGGRDAVQHLAELRHRDIAIINGDLSATNSLDRFNGYLAAMRERGLAVPDRWVLNARGAHVTDPLREQLQALLRSERRPTAIVAAGYNLALEVLELAPRMGLRIPWDLSLVGFDDPKSAALLQPPLTTVRQPLDEMGRLAMQELVELMADRGIAPRTHVLPTELVVRGTTTFVPRR